MVSLAQVGVDPGAFAIAAIVMFILGVLAVLLVAGSILLLVLGLARVGRRSGKVMLASGLALAVAVSVATYAAIGRPRSTLRLDFRSSRTPPQGEWFTTIPPEQALELHGDIDCHFLFPDGKRFEGHALAVDVTRVGPRVTGVQVQLPTASQSDAFAAAGGYISEWCDSGERKRFDTWCADRRAGKPPDQFHPDPFRFTAGNARLDPQMSIDVRESGEIVLLRADWR